MRQTGMDISLALSLAVAAGSMTHDVIMKLSVETDVQLGSQVMQEFTVGMHSAFVVSTALCLIAAALCRADLAPAGLLPTP